MESGWKKLVFADGTLRGLWRILLFFVLFVPLLTVAVWVAGPAWTGKGALFRQGAAMFVAAWAAGTILLVRIDGRAPGALGFAWTSRTLRELGLGFGIGGGALALIVGIFALVGWIGYRSEPGTVTALAAVLATDLGVLAIAAAAEEALFRGYPFQVLAQSLGPVAATVLASGAFALAHARNPNVDSLALVNIFLAGALLSAAYLRTRSLWFATAVHLGWNWTMASLLDLPVSGLAFFDTPFIEPFDAGPAWATGGAFGPEGGIGASLALGLALLAVLRLPGLDETDELRERRPLVDARAME